MPNISKKSKSYPFYFWLVLILIPFVLLIAAEVLLRLVNYGTDLSLLQTITIQGKNYYTINPQTAQRYFADGESIIPDARNDLFLVDKTPHTVRIFCMGGSTTAGWPFLYNGTFPSLLKDRLQILFPTKNFEVINLGISAINSFSILDMTRELIHYDPDLFLIYMGHNEFYGALGVASTQSIGHNRSVIKFYLKLQKLRLALFMKNSIRLIKDTISSPKNYSAHATLMQQMVKDKFIRYRGHEYEIAKNNFAQNLSEIIITIKKNNIPVLVGTLVSNLRDHEPFESLFSENFPDSTTWLSLFKQGEAAQKQNDFERAITLYQQAAALDSMPALLHYRTAQCYDSLKHYSNAAKYYIHARDLDALRFRASSDFNEVIHHICKNEQVPVIEIEDLFIQNSSHGLIGNELMIEHLHPNLEGYSLMADAFCKGMSENNIAAPKSQWQCDIDKTEADYLQLAYVTDLETEIANVRIKQLTSRWPFTAGKSIRSTSSSEDEQFLRQVVANVLYKNLPFNDACYQLATYFIHQKRYDDAEPYYCALIKIRPMNYYPHLMLGNLFFVKNDFPEAEKNYQASLALSKDMPFAYAKLGLLYLSQNEPITAQHVLEKAVAFAKNTNQFSVEDNINVRYLLATAYAQTEAYEQAKKVTEAALKLQPGNKKLQGLLNKINYVTHKRQATEK